MNDIINIPLNKLTAWEGNVRKTRDNAGIDALAASIKAHGLLQSLVVRKAGKKFAVVAGSRRLEALSFLVESGDISPAFDVPCRVIEKDDNATELSLAENAVRENMHPADEFEAFRDLIDHGKSVADVAAAFGVTETVVTRRLKLGRVSPLILAAYREEEIDLEEVMAFAISDNHAAQEQVYQNLQPNRLSYRNIRAALTENEIPATDKRVKLIGLEAYEQAGGAIKRDLFSDTDDNRYLLDTVLLDKLVADKLETIAASVRAECWKWVEIRPDFGYDERGSFKRVYPEQAPLSAELEAERQALQAEYDAIDAPWQESEKDAECPERLDEILARIDEIDDSREDVFTSEQLAMAGAVVHIGINGEANIERGLVKPEDMPKKSGKISTAQNSVGETAAPALSASLVENLTAHKSAAIAACLKDRPTLALASVVYTMALGIFEHRFSETALKVTATAQPLNGVEGSKAFTAMTEARETWGNIIPGNPADFWQWCLSQHTSVLLDLLAFCAACTVNAVQDKSDRADNSRLKHAGQLASELNLYMPAWFTPTADNYFNRVGRPQILEALKEADATPPGNDMKKADIARYAERILAPKGWLPAILR